MKKLSIALTLVVATMVMSSCKDDKTEDFTLNPIPAFGYSVVDWLDEDTGYLVDFANYSHYALSFEWDFGDGSTAKYDNTNTVISGYETTVSRKESAPASQYGVVHYYKKAGTYDVTLTVENSMLIRNSVTNTIVVKKDTTNYTDDNNSNEEPME